MTQGVHDRDPTVDPEAEAKRQRGFKTWAEKYEVTQRAQHRAGLYTFGFLGVVYLVAHFVFGV